jgi:hypothetical protein
VQHPEHRIKSVAQEFGTAIVENAADNDHSVTRAAAIFIGSDKRVGKPCDSLAGNFRIRH